MYVAANQLKAHAQLMQYHLYVDRSESVHKTRKDKMKAQQQQQHEQVDGQPAVASGPTTVCEKLRLVRVVDVLPGMKELHCKSLKKEDVEERLQQMFAAKAKMLSSSRSRSRATATAATTGAAKRMSDLGTLTTSAALSSKECLNLNTPLGLFSMAPGGSSTPMTAPAGSSSIPRDGTRSASRRAKGVSHPQVAVLLLFLSFSTVIF